MNIKTIEKYEKIKRGEATKTQITAQRAERIAKISHFLSEPIRRFLRDSLCPTCRRPIEPVYYSGILYGQTEYFACECGYEYAKTYY